MKTKNLLFFGIFSVAIFLFGMMFVHIRRNRFEQNAKTYIGKSMSEAWVDLNLEKREKYFQLQSFYFPTFNSTYQRLTAGKNEAGKEGMVYCYYNGSKCVCFLYDDETQLVTDCYTTTPLPASFDGRDFIGQPYEVLYEKFGKPAADGKFRTFEESREYRIIRYLEKSQIFLSAYTMDFIIDDNGTVKKIETTIQFV